MKFTNLEAAYLYIKAAITKLFVFFFDMDGVLADFYNHPEWYEEMNNGSFFEQLSPYQTTVACIKRLTDAGCPVFILSAANNEEVAASKQRWLDQYLPFLSAQYHIIVPTGTNKADVLGNLMGPNCVLIDDYNKNLDSWVKAGGTAVKFVNEVNNTGLIGEPWSGYTVNYKDTLMTDHLLAFLKPNRSNKCCFLFVGPSGSGKTTVTEWLEAECGYKALQSMTDRPPRYEGETGHTFVTKEEFAAIPRSSLCAYTMFSGHNYGATEEMVDNSDMYVIDVHGIRSMKERYKGQRRLVVIGLSVDEDEARYRMGLRGDKPQKIEERIVNDRTAFADMDSVCDYVIPAVEARTVFSTVKAIMEFHNSKPYVTPEETIRFYRAVERGDI